MEMNKNDILLKNKRKRDGYLWASRKQQQYPGNFHWFVPSNITPYNIQSEWAAFEECKKYIFRKEHLGPSQWLQRHVNLYKGYSLIYCILSSYICSAILSQDMARKASSRASSMQHTVRP